MTLRQISTCWIMQNPLEKKKHVFFDGGRVKTSGSSSPNFLILFLLGRINKSRSYPGSKKKSIHHGYFFSKADVFADISAWIGWLLGSFFHHGPPRWQSLNDPEVSNFQKWTGCWFQIFFIFTPIWGRFPFWLIFVKWVETTNQMKHNLENS